MATVSEWLESGHRPGRAGHPEEWRTEAIRQVVFLGLSERQAAKNLGVSRNTVAKWLREDSDQTWLEMRALGWIGKHPEAAAVEA
jgi:transposase-like protein